MIYHSVVYGVNIGYRDVVVGGLAMGLGRAIHFVVERQCALDRKPNG